MSSDSFLVEKNMTRKRGLQINST